MDLLLLFLSWKFASLDGTATTDYHQSGYQRMWMALIKRYLQWGHLLFHPQPPFVVKLWAHDPQHFRGWLPLAWRLGLTWIPRYQLFLPSSWRESSNQSLRQSKRVVCPKTSKTKAGRREWLAATNVWDDCDWDFPGCFSRISSWSAWGEH